MRMLIIPATKHYPHEVAWTDESPGSRYGIGVIEIAGRDYGPRDLVPDDRKGRTINGFLADIYRYPANVLGDITCIRRFMQQWPDGPQIEP